MQNVVVAKYRRGGSMISIMAQITHAVGLSRTDSTGCAIEWACMHRGAYTAGKGEDIRARALLLWLFPQLLKVLPP